MSLLARWLARWLLGPILLLGMAGSLAGCGGSESTLIPVDLGSGGFMPHSAAVQPGDVVVFHNRGFAAARILATNPQGLFDSGATTLIPREGAFEWKVAVDDGVTSVAYEEYTTTLDGVLTIVR